MYFCSEARLTAGVAETHAGRGDALFGDCERTPAKALRPEIGRFLTAAGDRPVLHHGLPRLAPIRGAVDVVANAGVGRAARSELTRGMDRHSLLAARRCVRHGDLGM